MIEEDYEELQVALPDVQEEENLGILEAFESNGFNSFIPFSELKFDQKTDFLAGGGYGDVFKGVWEGAPVAIKRFGKRLLSTKKAIKDFIKEIEVLNQLRHPNIVQYLGVSIDSS